MPNASKCHACMQKRRNKLAKTGNGRRIVVHFVHSKTNKKTRMLISKVLVEVEIPPIFILLLPLSLHVVFFIRARHHARLLIIADAFLEEIGLAGQGDGLHKIERVGRFVVFLVPEREEQAVGHEFDVLLHEIGVHAQQRARQGFGQEFLLNGDGFGDDVLHGLF